MGLMVENWMLKSLVGGILGSISHVRTLRLVCCFILDLTTKIINLNEKKKTQGDM